MMRPEVVMKVLQRVQQGSLVFHGRGFTHSNSAWLKQSLG